MTPRHLAMGVALVLAAGLVLFGDNAPESEVAEPVRRAAPAAASATAPAASAAPARGQAAAPSILRLIPRATLIGDSDEAMGSGADVFGRRDWTPPPPPPPKQEAPPPPPPPQAPPLPFTFIGKAVSQGNWEVFLARGDQTYIVKDKMIIDGTYRVDAIAPPILKLTYLPLNQVQQINIGVLD
ncbi:hypothetical protein KY495_01800 [Massilia sp. PAMC28688]|uniref:hypothetical protein n=1 Tax=Massilia sp. PAMC28688 TaxID=2861283 RepID=UPI001C62BC49|nr:hypothetical protein [Massilia sp. PAMC28688]QYF93997.1 hypothetical protein KY495_01800 [Massilia sp. PAMC28688]